MTSRAAPDEASAAIRGDPLAVQLSDLARAMERETDVGATLDAIVTGAVSTIPGADEASISAVRRPRRVVTVASTGELPRAVDQAQYDSGQGPCLDALYQHETVRLPDLSRETRWPDFVARVRQFELGSMLALRLYVDGDELGALNLLSHETNVFTDESENVAVLFASHAALAMAHAEKRENLTAALSSRDLLGQAKGILMERYKLTALQAFAMLAQASSVSNRRVVDIAEELSSTGELPSR